MCGIVGVFGQIGLIEKKIFHNMLSADILRGQHSTGVFKVDKKTNEVSMSKAIGLPWDLYAQSLLLGEEFFGDNNLVAGDTRAIIGHNRQATVGEKTENNAHPFEFDKVIGVHNGTLSKWSLDKEYPALAKQYPVDSQVLLKAIDDNDGDVASVFSKIHGAQACLVWDKTRNVLYAWRNKERPMHIRWSNDEKTILFASIPSLLTGPVECVKGATEKFKFAKDDKGVESPEIFYLGEDRLYTISWEGGAIDFKTEKMDAPFLYQTHQVYTPQQYQQRTPQSQTGQTTAVTTVTTGSQGGQGVSSSSPVTPSQRAKMLEDPWYQYTPTDALWHPPHLNFDPNKHFLASGTKYFIHRPPHNLKGIFMPYYEKGIAPPSAYLEKQLLNLNRYVRSQEPTPEWVLSSNKYTPKFVTVYTPFSYKAVEEEKSNVIPFGNDIKESERDKYELACKALNKIIKVDTIPSNQRMNTVLVEDVIESDGVVDFLLDDETALASNHRGIRPILLGTLRYCPLDQLFWLDILQEDFERYTHQTKGQYRLPVCVPFTNKGSLFSLYTIEKHLLPSNKLHLKGENGKIGPFKKMNDVGRYYGFQWEKDEKLGYIASIPPSLSAVN